MIDDGLCLVSEKLWGDHNLRNMTGDTTTPEAGRGGSERPRRHHFGASKNTDPVMETETNGMIRTFNLQ